MSKRIGVVEPVGTPKEVKPEAETEEVSEKDSSSSDKKASKK
jgi:hypothetical protein